MITEEQLKKLGIIVEPVNIGSNNVKYWCDITDSYIKIYSNDNPVNIIKKIYLEGVKEGIEQGKIHRSNQIKSILNNEDLE